MALSYNFLIFCSLVILISPSIAQTSFRPKALLLPVTKDSSTLQYVTQIKQRTPLVPVKLTLDLGGQFLWVSCEEGYVSSSYNFAPCHSAPCSLAKASFCDVLCFSQLRPGCNNHTCSLLADNPINGFTSYGDLSMDVVSLQSTDGKNPGNVVSVPKLLFVCGGDRQRHLTDLAKGVMGIAGLGRTRVSLPSLFSSAFSFPRKFAICLSPSTKANGVVFFGDGPYVMNPGVDVSKSLIYTPLIINPVTTAIINSLTGVPSSDYFIGVKSIRINRHVVVSLNTSLLSIDKKGYGGTKISTVHPYTVMETSIYEAFTKAFIKELDNIVPRVESISPFGACFNSTAHFGVPPNIDLVLESGKREVYWRIFGANSMVKVRDDVMCLGFVDGGVNPRTSIVIGGHQLEDNLLQFDLARSRLGFSSSLLVRQITCSNFNFTSHA